jgi:hypothetical protein
MKTFLAAVLAALLFLPAAAMADTDNFPMYADTVCSGPQTATTTSTSFTSTIIGMPRVLVVNTGTSVMNVTTGNGSATATGNSMPVSPGSTAVFSKKPNHNVLAAIAASGTDSFYFCFGQGI